ncbi:hypothetical protein [[Phormidium] sp. ETS-05]|uniref:hypothetical protein n=1 Tax=[Phormidium] sp. ETS-05 TaxID=222819 RepID=UPI0018EEF330|nr:hypothetical protein [[Phormidium] sp. ETS-05]
MAYSDFTVTKVKQEFNLTIREEIGIWEDIAELNSSAALAETLRYNLPMALASNSEKARSEMIITPILIELRKQVKNQFNLFSGVDFNVDVTKGLNGTCDFILSKSPAYFAIEAPIITIVEAKKENLNSGLGQCIAEMVAARIFNEKSGNDIRDISGVVTSGTNWRFLKLEGQVVKVDLTEYFLSDLNKILGILASGVGELTIDN